MKFGMYVEVDEWCTMVCSMTNWANVLTIGRIGQVMFQLVPLMKVAVVYCCWLLCSVT